MLSVKKCKKILEDNSSKKYTDDEVQQIREFLYKSSEIIIENRNKSDEKF
tara:strand:+ start:1971 stop:2120 length:150 start_codon:yes stop_codon:yes gene_type:complete